MKNSNENKPLGETFADVGATRKIPDHVVIQSESERIFQVALLTDLLKLDVDKFDSSVVERFLRENGIEAPRETIDALCDNLDKIRKGLIKKRDLLPPDPFPNQSSIN